MFTTVVLVRELRLHKMSAGLWSVGWGLTVSSTMPGLERKARWLKLRHKVGLHSLKEALPLQQRALCNEY